MGDGARVLEYTVILHRDEDYAGYWVEVPALPGCVSQGKSKEEALKNIKEAIELHVECMRRTTIRVLSGYFSSIRRPTVVEIIRQHLNTGPPSP